MSTKSANRANASGFNKPKYTLLENVYDGLCGAPPDPQVNANYPIPNLPPPTYHTQRMKCDNQIKSVDREDEIAPAATGIIFNGPGNLLMTKVIRNVHISWRGDEVYIPLRIQFEVSALKKAHQLALLMHQWGYWVDPESISGALPGQRMQGGMGIGEVYISILKPSGVTLREYSGYTDLGNEQQRTVFLEHMKEKVAERIMKYAEAGIFHGGLNLGNIHITNRYEITRDHTLAHFPILVDYDVEFSDWGWARSVVSTTRRTRATKNKNPLDRHIGCGLGLIEIDDTDYHVYTIEQACTDPWRVADFMVKSDLEGIAPVELIDYVDEVFKVAYSLKGKRRGGVDERRRAW